MPVTAQDIAEAAERIGDGIYRSPCPPSIPLSELCDAEIHCKLEYLQRTGSFKERGARNALLQLSHEQKKAGVIAASAGNHALGLSYHGQLLQVPVTVVMPKNAPLIKRVTCERLGAKVVLAGDTFDDAQAEAYQLRDERGLAYVHGFDDDEIIAGQGSAGVEILEQVKEIDAIVVPIGGGGLIAGIALWAKTQQPNIKIIGVEPDHAAGFSAALKAGGPVDFPLQPTLADGLAVSRVGKNAFATAKDLIDDIVVVSEEEIALAVLRLMELEKGVVEGGGAASLAAFFSAKLKSLRGKKVVLVLSGGNIEPMVMGRIIERGMVHDGRLVQIVATIGDYPGELARLSSVIASVGAGIREITHDRTFAGPQVSDVNVVCTVETQNHRHIEELFAALQKNQVRFSHRG